MFVDFAFIFMKAFGQSLAVNISAVIKFFAADVKMGQRGDYFFFAEFQSKLLIENRRQ